MKMHYRVEDANGDHITYGDRVATHAHGLKSDDSDTGVVRGIGAGDRTGMVLVEWEVAGEAYWEVASELHKLS